LVWHGPPRGKIRLTQPHSHEPPPERGRGMTGDAIAKYGIILIIVIVVLWFVANYFLGEWLPEDHADGLGRLADQGAVDG
jgi:hypothetical protein